MMNCGYLEKKVFLRSLRKLIMYFLKALKLSEKNQKAPLINIFN